MLAIGLIFGVVAWLGLVQGWGPEWVRRQGWLIEPPPLMPESPPPARSSEPTPAPPPPASNSPVTPEPEAAAPATPATGGPAGGRVRAPGLDYVPPAPAMVAGYPRPVRDVLEAQLVLIRHGFSPGPIDGLFGEQTAAALAAFQEKSGLPVTGRLDADTRARLLIEAPALGTYVVTSDDVARLTPISPTWLGKSQQERLDYETLLELIAEKHRASQRFVERLNPEIDWQRLGPGDTVQVPRRVDPTNNTPVAALRILLHQRRLLAYDAAGRLMASLPCSIARRVEKRPVGRLEVQVVIPNPNYTFDPAIYPESAEGRRLGRRLVVPPGPNNPVGLAWIGLSRPGYGIHGTPVPENVGRTESHGCFRLANWDVVWLSRLVRPGIPVDIEP
ncbi:MAG: murein L,D-transpeptidase [Verrucomicrobia bacterium]|nr:MAG: murein L,D-transpeptidase [Verrucomicrobiota bacterium]